MKVLRILFVLWVLMGAAHAESAYERVNRTGVLRCGFMPWPPFFDIDPNSGKVTGFNADVVESIAGFLNLKVEYIQITLGQQVQDLQNDRIDAICGDAPWLPVTIRYIDFASPYSYQGSYIYGRINNHAKTPRDLNNANVTFIGIDGDVSSDIATRRFPKAKLRTLGSTADSAQMLMEVATGKADAVIVDSPSAERFIKSNPGKIRLMFKEPIAVQGSGFSVKKGEQGLLNMLNESVHTALNNGLIDDIIHQHDPAGALYFPVAKPYR